MEMFHKLNNATMRMFNNGGCRCRLWIVDVDRFRSKLIESTDINSFGGCRIRCKMVRGCWWRMVIPVNPQTVGLHWRL